MHRITLVLVVLAVPLPLSAGTDDDLRKELRELHGAVETVRKELRALQGTWKTVGGAAAGKPFPKDSLDFTMVIAADGKSTGRLPKSEFQFTIAVDPGKTPKTIENRHLSGAEKGKTQYGVYKLEGDRFTVCVTRAGSPAADRPRDFATKGTSNVVFVFERVKAKPER